MDARSSSYQIRKPAFLYLIHRFPYSSTQALSPPIQTPAGETAVTARRPDSASPGGLENAPLGIAAATPTSAHAGARRMRDGGRKQTRRRPENRKQCAARDANEQASVSESRSPLQSWSLSCRSALVIVRPPWAGTCKLQPFDVGGRGLPRAAAGVKGGRCTGRGRGRHRLICGCERAKETVIGVANYIRERWDTCPAALPSSVTI